MPDDIRITSHKCAGQWTVVARLPYDAEVALRAIIERREKVFAIWHEIAYSQRDGSLMAAWEEQAVARWNQMRAENARLRERAESAEVYLETIGDVCKNNVDRLSLLDRVEFEEAPRSTGGWVGAIIRICDMQKEKRLKAECELAQELTRRHKEANHD